MKYAYLVVGRTNLDDVPLRLLGSRKAAEKFAAKVTGDMVHKNANKLMRVDSAGLINVAIIKFTNGKPGEVENIRELVGDQ